MKKFIKSLLYLVLVFSTFSSTINAIPVIVPEAAPLISASIGLLVAFGVQVISIFVAIVKFFRRSLTYKIIGIFLTLSVIIWSIYILYYVV